MILMSTIKRSNSSPSRFIPSVDAKGRALIFQSSSVLGVPFCRPLLISVRVKDKGLRGACAPLTCNRDT
jgi:hypothetical protein